jgi:hypothetical protein
MFLVVASIPDMLPCKFHGGYYGDVLVLFQVGYLVNSMEVTMEMFLFCYWKVTMEEYLVTTLHKCCSCFLFLFQAGHR